MMRDDDEDDEEGERGQHNNNRPVGEVAERKDEERGRILFKSTPFHKGGLFYLCAERFEGTIGGCRERGVCARRPTSEPATLSRAAGVSRAKRCGTMLMCCVAIFL